MYSEAGIQGTKTNHSLRATGVSEVFQVGVPDNFIKERTINLIYPPLFP